MSFGVQGTKASTHLSVGSYPTGLLRGGSPETVTQIGTTRATKGQTLRLFLVQGRMILDCPRTLMRSVEDEEIWLGVIVVPEWNRPPFGSIFGF
jgi:hypothetical protein